MFECKTIDPFKDQTMEGNYTFGYFENTDRLQNNALSSLTGLTKREIQDCLVKLRETRLVFIKIDRIYDRLLLKSGSAPFSFNQLKKEMVSFEFICSDTIAINGYFLNTLYNTILYRLHSLVELISETEDYLTEKNLRERQLKAKKNPSH